MRSVIFAFSVLVAAAALNAWAQQTKAPRDAQRILTTKVPSYTVRATNLLQAAAEISSDFRLPIGVEWGGDLTAKKEIDREWHDTTLAQIIHDVATFDVEYQVEISNGVVHLRNLRLADSSRNPLNIRIPTFSTRNAYTKDAVYQLSKQMTSLMFPREKQRPEASSGSHSYGAGEVQHSLSMSDASARDILDALLTRSDFAMWVVVFPSVQPDAGYLRTEYLSGYRMDPQYPNLTFVTRYHDPTSGSFRSDWQFGLRRP